MKSNLWIIDEIFSKLSDLKKNKKYFTKSTDFTRDSIFTFEMIFCLIVNLPRRSLSLEIMDTLEIFNKLRNEDKTGTKSGFCKARKKIKVGLFELINNYLLEKFYSFKNFKMVKRWEGFILLAIDGSVIELVDSPSVREKFGAQINQFTSTVQGRMLLAYDILNKQIKHCILENLSTGEITIAKDWVSKMSADILCIYDRGFPSMGLLFLHHNNKAPYLMRCKTGFNKYITEFVKSGKKDQIKEWKINKRGISDLENKGITVKKDATIKVRMIKVILSSGQVEILITSLLDTKKYPHKLFKKLYFKRWCVETKIGFLKNTLQLELNSGKSVQTVLQDFYGTIIRSNIQSLIEIDCESEVKSKCKKRQNEYDINHSIAAGILKNKFACLIFSKNRKFEYDELRNLFIKYLEPVRKNRKFERIRKRKHSGKYRPFSNYKKIA